MFKALFIGYLFGVRSERQLMREIEVNVAYRWFLGLKLTDPVFDASTLSQNRRQGRHDARDLPRSIILPDRPHLPAFNPSLASDGRGRLW